MDHYRSSQQQQDQDGLGAIPVSLGTYHNPPPPHPPANPIRVSAFSKPSSSSSLNILSPRDHHHHHHHHPHHVSPSAARNNNGSSTADFTTPAAAAAADHHPLQDPIPVSVSPSSAAAATAATTGSAPNSKAAVKYRECLRNHAASVGGHVLDGCCEFMPSGADPLKCAACDCHRSFHRKLTEGEHAGGSYYSSRRDRISVPLLLPPPHPAVLHHHSHPSQKQQQQFASSAAAFPPSPSGHMAPGSSPMMAFGGNNSGSGATTESSSEERLEAGVCAMMPQPNTVVSKKRHRTRFSAEQKEKMMEFAERVGWRIQRQDDATVENLCREIGVRRQVLKVWMHNNKHSFRKQQEQDQQLQQHIHQEAAADSASTTPTSQPPAPPIFGHVRN